MVTIPKNTKATVISSIRYRDAAGMIDWLCRNVGFERHAVYEGEGGTIEHSELTFGNGMVTGSRRTHLELRHLRPTGGPAEVIELRGIPRHGVRPFRH
jgi:hypothetical protein